MVEITQVNQIERDGSYDEISRAIAIGEHDHFCVVKFDIDGEANIYFKQNTKTNSEKLSFKTKIAAGSYEYKITCKYDSDIIMVISTPKSYLSLWNEITNIHVNMR